MLTSFVFCFQHVRNDALDMGLEEQEQRLRVWHSLSYLDSLLSLVTGRPPTVQERTCNAPVPRLLIPTMAGTEEVDPAFPDPYMVACTSLSAITAEMMSRLYTPRSKFDENKSLDDLRRDVELLGCYMQRWKRDLPESLDFEKPQTDQNYIHQVSLAPPPHQLLGLCVRLTVCCFVTESGPCVALSLHDNVAKPSMSSPTGPP
jgi:hypothetical protein